MQSKFNPPSFKKLKKTRLFIIAIFSLALALTLTIPFMQTPEAESPLSADPTGNLPDVYIIGSGYADAWRNGGHYNGEATYSMRNKAGSIVSVANSIANSVVSKSPLWNPAEIVIGTSAYPLNIPKKIAGKYDVEGIEWVKTYNLDLGFPTGSGDNYVDFQFDELQSAIGHETNTSPFSVDGKSAIIVTTSGGAYNSTELYTSIAKYASNNCNMNFNFNPTTYSASLNISAKWQTIKTDDNQKGELWNAHANIKEMQDEVDSLSEAALNDPVLSPKISPLSKSGARQYLKSNPSTKISNVYGVASGATSYNEWISAWKSYLISDKDPTATLGKIWLGTYTIPKDEANVRIYAPYVIKLKLKKSKLDLELISPDQNPSPLTSDGCEAFYDNHLGAIKLKLIGNLKSCPEDYPDLTVKSERVSVSLTNLTITSQNNFQGFVQPSDYKLSTPINPILNGSSLSRTGGDIASPTVSGDYLVFPVKPDPFKTQQIKVYCFINDDKNPEEGEGDPNYYKNNPYVKIVEIPPSCPDLIAHSINPGYLESGGGFKIEAWPVTRADDITPDILAKYPQSPVTLVAEMNGAEIFSTEYQHPLAESSHTESFFFNIGGFAPGETEKVITFILHINPTEDAPPNELTYENNIVKSVLVITNENPATPPPSAPDPKLPEYTTIDSCLYIDKNATNTDSIVLMELGTFTKTYHNQADGNAYPDSSSETAWIKGKNIKQRGLNYGKVVSYKWDPVFPNNGINGWISSDVPSSLDSCCPKCKKDTDCQKTVSDYQNYYNNNQTCATFTYYDTHSFQSTNGSSLVWQDEVLNFLRLPYRTVSNYDESGQPYEDDECMYIKGSPGKINPVPARYDHEDHLHTYTYQTTDENGKPVTKIGTCFIHYQGSCAETGAWIGGKHDEPHCHDHSECRLEYISEIVLQYNLKFVPLSEANTKPVDYGTNLQTTRAGYGFYSPIRNVNHITDYTKATAGAQYGKFELEHYDSKAYIRSPYTNKLKPYLISLLEEKDATVPFTKNYQNVKNEKRSKFKYREVFIDKDYPDTDGSTVFPVIHAIWIDSLTTFVPADDIYFNKFYPKAYKLHNKYPAMPVGYGSCFNDTNLEIRGNSSDDAWSHVDMPE